MIQPVSDAWSNWHHKSGLDLKERARKKETKKSFLEKAWEEPIRKVTQKLYNRLERNVF